MSLPRTLCLQALTTLLVVDQPARCPLFQRTMYHVELPNSLKTCTWLLAIPSTLTHSPFCLC